MAKKKNHVHNVLIAKVGHQEVKALHPAYLTKTWDGQYCLMWELVSLTNLRFILSPFAWFTKKSMDCRNRWCIAQINLLLKGNKGQWPNDLSMWRRLGSLAHIFHTFIYKYYWEILEYASITFGNILIWHAEGHVLMVD